MTSLAQMFGTNKDLEKAGIEVRYGKNFIRIARAGGSNDHFGKVMERIMRPHRRMIDANLLDNDTARDLLAQAYAEGVVLGWRHADLGEGQIELEEGKPLSFSRENVIKLFTELPDLFADIQEQASKHRNFSQAERENDTKN